MIKIAVDTSKSYEMQQLVNGLRALEVVYSSCWEINKGFGYNSDSNLTCICLFYVLKSVLSYIDIVI